MTEAEWLNSDDPRSMTMHVRDKVGDRKCRLFAAACCRRVWHVLDSDVLQPGVELIERYADNQASDGELEDAYRSARHEGKRHEERREWRLQTSRGSVLENDLLYLDSQNAYLVACAAKRDNFLDWVLTYATQCTSMGVLASMPDQLHHRIAVECAALSRLLRDVFGNPFCPVAFDPRWKSETAVALANGIYAERAFERMPILADALEHVGCDNTDILSHCRGAGPHVRGCWVVDLILGKS